jgi:hypothetical protein
MFALGMLDKILGRIMADRPATGGAYARIKLE